jgi:hypothetical protein
LDDWVETDLSLHERHWYVFEDDIVVSEVKEVKVRELLELFGRCGEGGGEGTVVLGVSTRIAGFHHDFDINNNVFTDEYREKSLLQWL